MNGESGPAILAEVLCDVVGNPFRADEDEDLCVFLTNLVEMFDELIAFLKLAADIDNLLNIVVGGELHGADVDLNKVAQEVLWYENEMVGWIEGKEDLRLRVSGRPLARLR